MPNYLTQSVYSNYRGMTQLYDNIPEEYIQQTTYAPVNLISSTLVATRDPSTSNFLNALVNKLHSMAIALKDQFTSLENIATHSCSRGVVFAEIDAPPIILKVKYEYILYIQRYGPPLDGVFNETYLAELRKELAAM